MLGENWISKEPRPRKNFQNERVVVLKGVSMHHSIRLSYTVELNTFVAFCLVTSTFALVSLNRR